MGTEPRPHPVDEYGLPVKPEDIQLECDPANCRYDQPFKDRQHVFHPRDEYSVGLLKKVRGCGRYVVRMCRCMHEQWDTTYQPPPKPTPVIIHALHNGELPYGPDTPIDIK